MFMQVAAHRGNVAGFPENTMPAYESAYEIGADMIELDLHMTKDGEIVLIHDGLLQRTTNMEGRIRDLTLKEVRQADAGIKTGDRFRGTPIPTLREFLDFVSKADDKMEFNFEFKDYIRDGEDFAKECADRIIEMVDSYGLWDRSFVNSFDGELLCYIEKKYNHRFRLHGFYPFDILGSSCPEKLYCACLFNAHRVNGKLIWEKDPTSPKEDFEAVKAAGIRPWIGAGVRKPEDIIRAADLGAELITTNEPAFVLEALKNAGYREGR